MILNRYSKFIRLLLANAGGEPGSEQEGPAVSPGERVERTTTVGIRRGMTGCSVPAWGVIFRQIRPRAAFRTMRDQDSGIPRKEDDDLTEAMVASAVRAPWTQ